MNRLQLDLAEVNQKLKQYLSPHNFVVGLKLSESVGEMERVPGRRKLDFHPRLCQVITLARTFGWTVGFTSQDLASTTCGSVVGLCERDKVVTDGTLLSGVFFKDEKEARKQQESIPLIPAGTCKAGAVAPLRKNKFIPDIILVYGNPAQMMRLMTGIQWSDYERLQFFYSGEGACVDSIVQCYQTRKPALTVPCFGVKDG